MKLACPNCRSTELLIRQATGFERLRIFVTGLRTFKCRDCYHDFRAPDRRKMRRPLHKAKQQDSPEETMFGKLA